MQTGLWFCSDSSECSVECMEEGIPGEGSISRALGAHSPARWSRPLLGGQCKVSNVLRHQNI